MANIHCIVKVYRCGDYIFSADVFARLMYFANWTEGTIEMVGMDGLNLQTLVKGGLQRPRSLTLDLQGLHERQLYWLETRSAEFTALKTCSLQTK